MKNEMKIRNQEPIVNTTRKKIIHCGFEDQVMQWPDRAAVEMEEYCVSYRELNARANRLAHFLRQLGTGKEPVGLLFDCSIGYTASFLAVLKAGAVPMPMNTAFPLKRLERMLKESETRVMLVTRDRQNMAQHLVTSSQGDLLKWVLLVEETLEFQFYEVQARTLDPTKAGNPVNMDDLPMENPQLINEPGDAGYIIYTSGSTGQPKAIVGMHMSLAHFIHWERTEFGLNHGIRVCQISTITFDPCLRDILVPLSAGGTVCIPSAEKRINVAKLATWLEKNRIQLIHIVPFLFRLLTDALAKKKEKGTPMLKALRYALIAGEPLYGKDVMAWRKVVGNHVELANLYGPTETTQSKLFYRIKEPIRFPARMVPVGKPISNAVELILDKNLKLCPKGETGEVYIKTPFRARGYLKNPGLTREVFIQNPLHNDFEDIVYKTGDLGRCLPDGNIELTGRADSQVKVNGVRIELEEIESHLLGFDKIDQAVVLAKEIELGKNILVAYYIPGQTVSEAEIRAYLGQYLPAVMVPKAYVQMESFPSLITGKIDKKALPEPDLKRKIIKEYTAPGTRVEKILVQVWEDVMEMKGIGITHRFFDLGSNSLQLLQIIARIRKELSVEVSLGELFRLVTIQALAREIENKIPLFQARIEPVEEKEYYEISHAQKRMWLLDQLREDQMAYNIKGAYLFEGNLNKTAFEQALKHLVKRHESLRTVFILGNGEPKQKILTPQDSASCLEIIDLRNHPDNESKALEIVNQESWSIFDLTEGPLLRLRLLRTGQEKYFFSYNIHHIISDGWSTGVLINGLLNAYRAGCRGEPYEPGPLPIQYKDYAEGEKKQFNKKRWEEQRQYWLSRLSGPLPVLELPFDYPRPKIQTYQGATEKFQVSPGLTRKIRSLSKTGGASLSMTMMAAFLILLSRYSQQQDIAVGTVVANRDRKEIEPLIGFFVNTLVLRLDVSGNPVFWELLDRVKEVTLGAFDHQDFPFEMLVEELQPERNVSHSPLFQVAFTFQHLFRDSFELPGLTMTSIDIGVTSKYDLTLTVVETEEALDLEFEFNTDLFKRSTIQRMDRNFQMLLQGIVQNPGQKIQELPLLTEKEKKQLIWEWNALTAPYPRDRGIHQWVQHIALQTPDAVALVFERETVTYNELNRRANQLARYLRQLGVDIESLVGVCIERSIQMIIALLGILKAGGAYVPMDPSYPRDRLAFMLRDSKIKTLVSQRDSVERLPVQGLKMVNPDTDTYPEEIKQQADDSLNIAVKGNHPAYMIYTSGSTGRPRGVLIEHAGIFNLVQEVFRVCELGGEGCLLQFASLSFDASVYEIFPALCAGARLVLASARSLLPGPGLIDLLKEQAITHVTLPPSVLAVFPGSPLPYLRTITVAGEACPRDVAAKWSKGRRFINAYGPTETTVWATAMVCSRVTGPPPIGRSIANTRIYLLDDQLRLVPIGVPGEIHIGGAGVARGYLNRPELTSEKFGRAVISHLSLVISSSDKFFPNDQCPMTNDRLYKTGDLGRYLPDGTIEFLGRIDQQVKIYGLRIETGEIEATLAKNPLVCSVVVDVRIDHQGSKRLAAYVIGNEKTKAEIVDQLRTYLANHLPTYMIPHDFILLEEFPLTPSGKIDRKALGTLDNAANAPVREYTAPSTPVEEVLAKIWGEVLGVEKVGVYDNFFKLGGDSILCIQAAARANQAGLEFTPKQLFTRQTIAQLAPVINGTPGKLKADQGMVTGQTPLTPIQQWFFEQDFPGLHHFNQSVLLEAPPDVNPALLEQVTEHILRHHDALRMRFTREQAGWVQENTDSVKNAVFEVEDLSRYPEEQQRKVLEETANRLQASLDLSEGPLVQVRLFLFGPRRPARLLFIIHHLVVDGVSWRILMEDVHRLYHQLNQEKEPRLPAKTTSFREWAGRLEEYAASGALNREESYWIKVTETGVNPIPVDYPFTPGWETNAAAAHVTIDLSEAETTALLKDVPGVYHTQINDVLLAALALTFRDWTGENRVFLDLEGHGREDLFRDVDLSRTVGWFTSLFPIRLEVDCDSDMGMILKSVKEQLRRIPNRGIGYGLLRYLRYRRKPGNHQQPTQAFHQVPQPQVLFNYMGQTDRTMPESPGWKLAKESCGADHSLDNTRAHLLEINAICLDNQLKLTWTYSKKLYNPGTIEHLAHRYKQNLVTLMKHCLSPEAGGFTPSDFPAARLNQDQLDMLISNLT